jgi:quercetin dioxygenase-like cupin family protein
MKARLFLTATIAAAALLLNTHVSHAQDPAVVNPTTVHVRVDNPQVRVLESELPPHAREQLHSHPACVMIVLTGGKARNHSDGGKINEVELTAGQVIYREPTTHWSENIGNTTIHLIIVELKAAT